MTSPHPGTAATANEVWYDSLPPGEYLEGAPHLKHRSLRALYSQLVERVFRLAARHESKPRVLDLGAGEGSATIPFLALGARVTAVDISARQLEGLSKRCAAYGPNLEQQCGDAAAVIERIRHSIARYDVVVANSFLHHVPDYVALLRDVVPTLSSHGIIFSFQDPLPFRRLGLLTRVFGAIGYFAWRFGQGDLAGGIMRRTRRTLGVYRADSQEDNAEYHVVRAGVDERLIEGELRKLGFQIEIVLYFSAQLALWQWLGTAMGLENTFAVIATRDA